MIRICVHCGRGFDERREDRAVPPFCSFAACDNCCHKIPFEASVNRLARIFVESLPDPVTGRTRCTCSYPHDPHDWCDGNPGGIFRRVEFRFDERSRESVERLRERGHELAEVKVDDR